MNYDIKAERGIRRNGISIYITQEHSNGTFGYVKPIELEIAPNEGMYLEPSMIIDVKTAQALMDELWSCGLRPTEGSGSAGSLAATQEHLKDMRKIAFDLLEDKGVKS